MSKYLALLKSILAEEAGTPFDSFDSAHMECAWPFALARDHDPNCLDIDRWSKKYPRARYSGTAKTAKSPQDAKAGVPDIVREPPFGSSGVPERYKVAWEALLAKCPKETTPERWRTAIMDGAELFGWWGLQLVAFGWTANDVLATNHGLAWALQRSYVAFLGANVAITDDRRKFRRGE